jgi:hypothetical protein
VSIFFGLVFYATDAFQIPILTASGYTLAHSVGRNRAEYRFCRQLQAAWRRGRPDFFIYFQCMTVSAGRRDSHKSTDYQGVYV